MRVLKRPVVLVALTVALGGMLYDGSAKPAAAEGLFDDMNIGLFSIGGRATYFDRKTETTTGSAAVRSAFIHFTFWPLKVPSIIGERRSIPQRSEPFRCKAPCCSIPLA